MNEDVKARIVLSGVKMWQVADALGICDGSLSRRLRKELSPEEKDKIYSIIDSISDNSNLNHRRETVFSAIKRMTLKEFAQFLDSIDVSGEISAFVCTEKCKYYGSCDGVCVYSRKGNGHLSVYEAFLSLDASDVFETM